MWADFGKYIKLSYFRPVFHLSIIIDCGLIKFFFITNRLILYVLDGSPTESVKTQLSFHSEEWAYTCFNLLESSYQLILLYSRRKWQVISQESFIRHYCLLLSTICLNFWLRILIAWTGNHKVQCLKSVLVAKK